MKVVKTSFLRNACTNCKKVKLNKENFCDDSRVILETRTFYAGLLSLKLAV